MIKYNVASMVGKIRDKVNKTIISELEKNKVEGIAPSHGDILICLYQKNGLSIKELVQKVHQTQPTVTVLIDKLEKLGYVKKTKCKEDNRVIKVVLTQKGIDLEPTFQKISERINTIIYENLEKEEQIQLEALLEKVLKGF